MAKAKKRMEKYAPPDLMTGVRGIALLAIGHAMRAYEQLGTTLGEDNAVHFGDPDPNMSDEQRAHAESIVLATTKQLIPNIQIVVGGAESEQGMVQILDKINKAAKRESLKPSQLFLAATKTQPEKPRAKRRSKETKAQ